MPSTLMSCKKRGACYRLLLACVWLHTLCARANAARVLAAADDSIHYFENIIPPFPVSCTGDTFSKQSCLFRDVCLQTADEHETLVAVLRGSNDWEHVSILQRHLEATFAGVYKHVRCILASNSTSSGGSSSSDGTSLDGSHTFSADGFQTEQDVTMLWRMVGANQYSYGHALVNEAFPMFLVLQNHFGQHIPARVQLLAAPSWHHVLQDMLIGAVTGTGQLMVHKMKSLPAGVTGFCVKHLVVGNGGYIDASRKSLADSRDPHSHWFSMEPTFFSSANWWNFRRHTLQVQGMLEKQAVISKARPLIVLNDKRAGLQSDRRMIDNIEEITAQLALKYPAADVRAVRFREMPWKEQVMVLSKTAVFITTQGSSAFRLVFLPQGATCVMLGAPENGTEHWTGFHELDRWFPLTHVDFVRYEVSIHNPADYRVEKLPGAWEPRDVAERYHWWLYNAHVRPDISRLQPIVDRALRQHVGA